MTLAHIIVPVLLAFAAAWALKRWGERLHSRSHTCRIETDNPWPEAYLLKADLDEFERQLRGGAA